MEDDIHFGEVEETAPRQQLRPDQNHHYAVVPYEAPAADDLPIYVELDVMREMEAHALSNTNVELGGVLLGGQFEDEEGQPFVLINDCLRAEHYQATKGSFKFTHDTWSEITRRRDAFAADMEMVGWYHTHPSWGVFLSGMDTFICDNFFNKPLDVALVIDPCQQERAFFQWTPFANGQKTRATSGFFLIASRFRLPELEIYIAQLEGTTTMSGDPRYSASSAGYPPVVHLAESRQPWLSVAVLGLLAMQFLVLALIAWRVVNPASPPEVVAAETQFAQVQAQRALLDQIIGKLDVAPEGLVTLLEEQRQQNQELRTTKLGLTSYIDQLEALQKETERERQFLLTQREELRDSISRLKGERTEHRALIADLKQQLSPDDESNDGSSATRLWAWIMQWKWYLSGAAILALAALAVLLTTHDSRTARLPDTQAPTPIPTPEEDN